MKQSPKKRKQIVFDNTFPLFFDEISRPVTCLISGFNYNTKIKQSYKVSPVFYGNPIIISQELNRFDDFHSNKGFKGKLSAKWKHPYNGGGLIHLTNDYKVGTILHTSFNIINNISMDMDMYQIYGKNSHRIYPLNIYYQNDKIATTISTCFPDLSYFKTSIGFKPIHNVNIGTSLLYSPQGGFSDYPINMSYTGHHNFVYAIEAKNKLNLFNFLFLHQCNSNFTFGLKKMFNLNSCFFQKNFSSSPPPLPIQNKESTLAFVGVYHFRDFYNTKFSMKYSQHHHEVVKSNNQQHGIRRPIIRKIMNSPCNMEAKTIEVSITTKPSPKVEIGAALALPLCFNVKGFVYGLTFTLGQ